MTSSEAVEAKKIRIGALWALATSVVIWSSPTIFQSWLLREWDVSTQNFYRYLVGMLCVLPFAYSRARALEVQLKARDVFLCAIPAVPLVVHQIAQTSGLHFIEPGIYTVIGRVSVIFTLILAFIFFKDERFLIRRPMFIFGSLLGVSAAMALLFIGEGGVGGGGIAAPGVFLAICGAFCWALYSVLVKIFAAHLGSTLGFAITSAWTCLMLFPIMLIWGDPATPWKVGWESNAVMIASGVLCIGLGHTFFYTAIRHLGASVSQNAILLSPFGALALSYFFFGETLSWGQLIFGFVLIGAVLITIHEDAKNKS